MNMDTSVETPLTTEQRHAALFAQMVMQLSSTALVMLGKAPNPMTGKTETDLEMAQLLVEQLEMLEVKTKGNLGSDEQRLLKQGLMTLRMAFVEAVNEPQPKATESRPEPTPVAEAATDESKKKFSKSYGEA